MMAFRLRPATPSTGTMSGLSYPDLLRPALVFSHDLLREQDLRRLQEMMLRDALELLGATVARLLCQRLKGSGGRWRSLRRL
jgi:hypothetical protein